MSPMNGGDNGVLVVVFNLYLPPIIWSHIAYVIQHKALVTNEGWQYEHVCVCVCVNTMPRRPDGVQQHNLQAEVSVFRLVYGLFRYQYWYIGKAIPVDAWTDPEGSWRLRLSEFKTIGTWRW
jgi:hypothetical protein